MRKKTINLDKKSARMRWRLAKPRRFLAVRGFETIEMLERRYSRSYKAVMSLLTLCIIAIAVYISFYIWQINSASSGLEDLSLQYTSQQAPEGEQQDGAPDISWMMPPTVDFDGLDALNPDIIAWLRIPGTSVDYPVLSPTEGNDEYLDKSYTGAYSISGSIFADAGNSKDLSDDHVVIYGHHMNADIMFHDVASYTDPEFSAEHSKIYLETRTTVYELEPIETHVVAYDDAPAAQTSFANEMDFQSYLDNQIDSRTVEDRRTIGRLFSLVTCTNGADNTRVVVQCKIAAQYPVSYIGTVSARIAASVK